MGLIKDINERNTPVFGELYLPENVRMLYASSDKPNESAANKMLALADRQASQLIDHILSEQLIENFVEISGKPYTHFRSWTYGLKS